LRPLHLFYYLQKNAGVIVSYSKPHQWTNTSPKLPVASCDEVGTVLREADGFHLGGHLVARHLQGHTIL
jgi:hypothetical protein